MADDVIDTAWHTFETRRDGRYIDGVRVSETAQPWAFRREVIVEVFYAEYGVAGWAHADEEC